MEVACGQCLACRLDRTLMWAMRIVHESTLHQDHYGNCFITLTYRERCNANKKQIKNGYYVPSDYSLDKTHFQKFIKRLRKYHKQKIRYFHCGEYGDETLRPHYHAALFNCSFPDQKIYRSDEGINTYASALLQELWPYGFSTIGELNFDTASYIAGYILKKVTGSKAADEYLRSDQYGVAFWVSSPYVTMSLGHRCEEHRGLPKRPGECKKCSGGIGADFYEKYKTDMYPSDETPVPGKGVVRKVPRYYDKILKEENPDLLAMVKELRAEFVANHREDFTPERLMDKYNVARAKQRTKTRAL